jgi:hypothetical protein
VRFRRPPYTSRTLCPSPYSRSAGSVDKLILWDAVALSMSSLRGFRPPLLFNTQKNDSERRLIWILPAFTDLSANAMGCNLLLARAHWTVLGNCCPGGFREDSRSRRQSFQLLVESRDLIGYHSVGTVLHWYRCDRGRTASGRKAGRPSCSCDPTQMRSHRG